VRAVFGFANNGVQRTARFTFGLAAFSLESNVAAGLPKHRAIEMRI
jgi:hypothetical protein